MFKFAIAAAAAGLLLQTQAFAGAYYNSPATVGANYGYGSVEQARFSSDSLQSVGCFLGTYVKKVTDKSAVNYISCSAVDSTGATYYCYDSTPPDSWIKMIAALNQASWIYFYGDSSHHCQGISTSQDSVYL